VSVNGLAQRGRSELAGSEKSHGRFSQGERASLGAAPVASPAGEHLPIVAEQDAMLDPSTHSLASHRCGARQGRLRYGPSSLPSRQALVTL
jgi:hypothetical protein